MVKKFKLPLPLALLGIAVAAVVVSTGWEVIRTYKTLSERQPSFNINFKIASNTPAPSNGEYETAGQRSKLWWQLPRQRSSYSGPGSKEGVSDATVEWLHLPKTGTSFGNTLILWACPELSNATLWMSSEEVKAPRDCLSNFKINAKHMGSFPIGDHHSLTNRTEDELGRVMTMIRYPPSRLASGYHWVNAIQRDHFNASVNDNVTEGELCDWVRNSTWAHATIGMMVKLVVGENLTFLPGLLKHEIVAAVPSDAMVQEACRRLHRFAFVGITEFWNASICLFHAVHGGIMHAVELENVRKGGYRQKHGVVQEAYCGDTADMQLYECGMTIFNRMLRAHPHCKEYMP